MTPTAKNVSKSAHKGSPHKTKNRDRGLPQEPLSVQIHNKIIWDLSRIDAPFDFYTIGYGHIPDLASFIDRLNSAGVETLADVRHNPVSQYRPDFSKSRLEPALNDAGIAYVHYSRLGVPKNIRSMVKSGADYKLIWDWYDQNVVPILDDGFYDHIIKKLKCPVAYMCVELDPTKCHRHRIALALERKGLRELDL